MQGIQKVIYDIIKTSRELGLPYMTITAIKAETMKTSLVELEKEFATTKRNLVRKDNAKKTKLDFAISQALNVLKKKKEIKQTKNGHWTVTKNANKYKPIVCRAIEEEYEIYCPKCAKYTYKITNKSRLKHKCPDCGKLLQIKLFRYHCPIRNTFIGNPVGQCELLHGVDMEKLTKKVFPMKICYFATKPTQTTVEYAKEKVKKEEEKDKQLKQYYYNKYHLHNFSKED